MVPGQVMPIARLMIHEIDTERRALPCDYSSNSVGAQNGFDSSLGLLPETFELPIYFSISFKQSLNGRDRSRYRDGMTVIRSGHEGTLGRIRIGDQLHQVTSSH